MKISISYLDGEEGAAKEIQDFITGRYQIERLNPENAPKGGYKHTYVHTKKRGKLWEPKERA